MANAGIRVLVRTRYPAELAGLQAAGASLVVSEELEGLARVGEALARAWQMDDAGVSALMDALRNGMCSGHPVRGPDRDSTAFLHSNP